MGAYSDRRDLTSSATNLIKARHKAEGWGLLELTTVGRRVQGNVYPYHYQEYWLGAVNLVQALSDGTFALKSAVNAPFRESLMPGQLPGERLSLRV
jgi:hypothetical protein